MPVTAATDAAAAEGPSEEKDADHPAGHHESETEETATTKASETSDSSSTNFLPYALIGLVGGALVVIAVTMVRKRKAVDTPPAE